MSASQEKTSIMPAELHRRLAVQPSALLLDVRTPAEFAAVHIPGAVLVPLGNLDAAALSRYRATEVTPVYVLCQSGGRARKAIGKLTGEGVRGCVLVEGGTQGWIDAGLPVELGASHGLPLMRQLQIIAGSISAAGAAGAILANPLFAVIPLVLGCGLLFAGATGICGLAIVLAKMPWNRIRPCNPCCESKVGA
jgi:rhodanese-related sulfurtransferase